MGKEDKKGEEGLGTSNINLHHRQSLSINTRQIIKNSLFNARNIFSGRCYDGDIGVLEEVAG